MPNPKTASEPFRVGKTVRVIGSPAYAGTMAEITAVNELTVELSIDGRRPLFYFEEVEVASDSSREGETNA